ncbi:hypothetical protein [Paraburkholderia terricola]|uniref:Uncharacterized protein n=1 Tax=Paraburkholderia terricola TaxID=169427 RepID=A0A1M6WSH1_9BURK|nr:MULTISPECIES: hypothetical protein [Paraburkholderia]SDP11046.1 hypothetical protein SAMN05192547_10429 [Paraburkholderia sediminicola]SHK96475.1 hypothetical protein SAMN05192548_104843 [Paraburkholderia terricola]
MTTRRPHETSDSAGDGARSARPAQSTLKAWLLPTPISVDSVALLLRLKEFVAVATETIENQGLMLEDWKLRAVLMDTRLCYADDFLFGMRRATLPSVSCLSR